MAPSAESDDFTCRIVDRLLSVNDKRNPSLTNCVRAEEIVELLQRCTKALLSQPVLLGVSPEIFICGDIHGQFTDLLRIFNRCQFPPTTSYLFLGDYVDRGSQQLEVICLLMCYKILYQGSFFLLRGNHECASINKVYGFYEECKRRYNVQLYNAFQDLFNSLPLAAIVAERIFCCHGGISPKILSFEQINHIQRPFDPPNGSFVIDLLWSDPDESCKTWGKNSRGVSVVFGAEAVRQFCQQFSIDLIVRGHQVVEDGFEFFANRKLVTVFSAPKYCGEFDNAGGIMHVNEDLTCSFQILKPISHRIRTNAPYKKKGSEKRKRIRTDKTQTVD